MFKTESEQVEYEIYLIDSQIDSLLKDLMNKKGLKTFKENTGILSRCKAKLTSILTIINEEV